MDTRFIGSIAAAAAGLGLILGVGALSFDFPCLPGYAASGLQDAPGRGAAMMLALKFSLQHPGYLLPAFAGFTTLFALALCAPLLVPERSKSRVLLGLAIAPLTIGVALWIAISGPGSDCSQASAALRLLSGAALGAACLYAAAWFWGRYVDQA